MDIVHFTVTFDLNGEQDWSLGNVPDGRHQEVKNALPFILTTMLRDYFAPKDEPPETMVYQSIPVEEISAAAARMKKEEGWGFVGARPQDDGRFLLDFTRQKRKEGRCNLERA